MDELILYGAAPSPVFGFIEGSELPLPWFVPVETDFKAELQVSSVA